MPEDRPHSHGGLDSEEREILRKLFHELCDLDGRERRRRLEELGDSRAALREELQTLLDGDAELKELEASEEKDAESVQKDKEREALEHLFERHAAKLLVYINYNLGERLRRKLDPADILQNVYLRLVKGFESFSSRAEERGVRNALIRMADHEISEAYRYHFKVEKRDARREVTACFLDGEGGEVLSPLDWVPSQSTAFTARIARREEYQRVMGILRQLSRVEQYVTVARVVEDVDVQEIADRLGKSKGAVHMLLARVRDKLRKRAAEPPTPSPREGKDGRRARDE